MDIILQLTYNEASLMEYLLRSYQDGRQPVGGIEKAEDVEDLLVKVTTSLDDYDTERDY